MTDQDGGRAGLAERAHGGTAPADAARETRPELGPARSTAATRQSFAAAGSQLNALARYGDERTDAHPIEDRQRATARRRQDYERVFLSEHALEFDANGLRNALEYRRAVLAIQAKAVALGYGSEAHAVPITSVPGGYIGRFGGHDIYAAAQ